MEFNRKDVFRSSNHSFAVWVTRFPPKGAQVFLMDSYYLGAQTNHVQPIELKKIKEKLERFFIKPTVPEILTSGLLTTSLSVPLLKK